VIMEWPYLLGAVLAVIGALIGVAIRRTTRFLFPCDFLSILLYVSLIMLVFGIRLINHFAEVSIWYPDIGAETYASFILGYVTGYCIDGRMNYVLVRRTDTDSKHSHGVPWVTYEMDNKLHLAVQTNRALWRRMAGGIHVPILSNAPFKADWNESTKYPLFPEFEKPMIMVESWDWVLLGPAKEDADKKRPPVRMGVSVKIAHGSMISVRQLCYERDAVTNANEGMAEANRKLIDLTHFVKNAIPRILTNFLADTYDKSPALAFLSAVDHMKVRELQKAPPGDMKGTKENDHDKDNGKDGGKELGEAGQKESEAD